MEYRSEDERQPSPFFNIKLGIKEICKNSKTVPVFSIIFLGGLVFISI